MKIGIAIAPLLQAKHIFPDLQELLEIFLSSEIGIKHFEIHTHLNILELEAFKLLRKSGAKFSIHVPHMYSNPPINLVSAKPEDIKQGRKWLEKSIDLARELKANYITLHPDVPKDRKQALEIFRNHLNYCLEIKQRKQVILIENMPGKSYLFHEPKELKEFIDSFKQGIGVTYDIGHAKLAIGSKFLDFPKILGKRIKECHFSDFKGKSDHHPLGQGNFDFVKIIRALKSSGFNDLIIMEIIPDEASGIDISKKVLEKAIKEA